MKKFVMVLASVFIIVVTILLGYLVYIISNGNNITNNNPTKRTYTYTPGEHFVTNVKESRRFLKTSIVLEVDNKKCLGQMQKNNHKIRDYVIEILSCKSEGDVKNDNIRDVLKREIISKIKEGIDINLVNVYFNEFVVQ